MTWIASDNIDPKSDANGLQNMSMLSPVQKMLLDKQKEKNCRFTSNSLGLKQVINWINAFDCYYHTKIDSIFNFWKNHDSKTLFQLAKVVLALLMTQVSVER